MPRWWGSPSAEGPGLPVCGHGHARGLGVAEDGLGLRVEAQRPAEAVGEVGEAEVGFRWYDNAFGGDCVFNLCQHVARHMLDGTPLENEASDYLAVQAIERACYKSSETRRWIDVTACL